MGKTWRGKDKNKKQKEDWRKLRESRQQKRNGRHKNS